MYHLADTGVQSRAQHPHLQAAQLVNMPIMHSHVHCHVHCTGSCVPILLYIPLFLRRCGFKMGIKAASPTSPCVSLLLHNPQYEAAIQRHAVLMCRWCLMRWQAARWQSTTELAAAMVRWRSCWGMWTPCWPAMATHSSLHLMSLHLSSSLQGKHHASCSLCCLQLPNFELRHMVMGKSLFVLHTL
jgi:hypothetical protein